jgi:hypothetical protein
MFRRIGGVVWDVTTGSIGLKTENGIYSLKTVPGAATGDAASYSVSVNPFDDFGLAIPAFATQSTPEEVQVGDIIVGDKDIIGWVVDKTPAAFKVLDHNSYVKTYVPPSVQILGNSGVLVVRNLFSLTGGAAGAGNFAQSLLPLMMLGGGDEKLEKMLPLLLMTSTAAPAANGTAAAANPMAAMLPLLLMKDGLGGSGGDGKMDKLLPFMMMGGLGGGAGGMNPMLMMALMGDGDLFGSSDSSSKKALTLPVTRGGIPVLNSGY